MSKISAYTVTESKALQDALKLVRERGWSFVNSELVAGLFGAATVKRSILYVQALPAIAAAVAVHYF